MAIISISDSQINSADQVLVADASSKIPAKDGSQITVLNATNVASGTIATARLDTGTTANKIVVLDGSGNLPVVDGSLLTGIVSATVSASDPTVSTNPSAGLGAEWNNSTSGEMYICTDATAGANVWTNVGAGTGDVPQLSYGGLGGGTSYGWAGGGYLGPPSWAALNSIEKYAYASDGNGTDAGDLTRTTNAFATASSTTHGYLAGGANIPVGDALERFQFSNNGNSVDIGSLVVGSQRNTPNYGAVNSTTHGYCAGGSSHQSIEKFTFSASATNTNVGNLIVASGSMAGNSSLTHGYFAARASTTNHIERLPFASDAGTTDVGDLAIAVSYATGTSSNTYGYVSGGATSGSYTNSIQKFAFASSSNATDIADSQVATSNRSSNSSLTHGYCAGGRDNNTNRESIDKWTFASNANATAVGTLTSYREQSGGWQE